MTMEMTALDKIRENPVALRTVNKQSEAYMGLVDSIRQKGFLGSITGRKKKDEAGQEYVEITDGLHRFSAARDAGIKQVPVDILSMTDAQTMEAQLMLNIHKVETKPVQYSQQLRRILSMNPLMTESELATKLGKSSSWIKERLGLVKLPEKVAGLVDEGKINLSNAYAIAKLPIEEMADWVDRAITQTPAEFIPAVNARVKEIKDAKRKGQDSSTAEFVPVAHLQKLAAIKSELDKPAIGPVLVKQMKAKSPEDGFSAAIAWVLHLDPKSVEVSRVKYEEQKAMREDEKNKRKVERAEKKAQEAAKEAADVSASISKKK